MNGYDICERAVKRLGYEDCINGRLLERAPELLNQIASDLKIGEITELAAPLSLSPERLEALCCGTAMLLAFTEGDGGKNRIFADIYNAKRASVLCCVTHIEDTMPVSESGDCG